MFTFPNNSHTLRWRPTTGAFYKRGNFVNEHHQEHASEAQQAKSKMQFTDDNIRSRYEHRWPAGAALDEKNVSASAPTFSSPSGTYNDKPAVSSISSDRKAFLDLNRRNRSPKMSVSGNYSSDSNSIDNTSNRWQTTTGGGTLQQVVVAANEVGSNAPRSPLVPTQLNQWRSQETLGSASQNFSSSKLRQLEQQPQLNLLLGNETPIHHHSHARTTSWPSKSLTLTSAPAIASNSAPTSTQTRLNFSFNDYSTNSDNNDNSVFETSDNWPMLSQWPRRPPASSSSWVQETTVRIGGGSPRATVVGESRTTDTGAASGTSVHHRLVDLDDLNQNCLPLSSSPLLSFSKSGHEKETRSYHHAVPPERVLKQQQSNSVTAKPESQHRAICEGCKAANLRVSIRLPMRVHKIIILKRPSVTFATTINQ